MKNCTLNVFDKNLTDLGEIKDRLYDAFTLKFVFYISPCYLKNKNCNS